MVGPLKLVLTAASSSVSCSASSPVCGVSWPHRSFNQARYGARAKSESSASGISSRTGACPHSSLKAGVKYPTAKSRRTDSADGKVAHKQEPAPKPWLTAC